MSRNLSNIKKSIVLASKSAAQVQRRLDEAVAHHQRGQLAQAKAIYEDILKIQSKHFDSLHLLGVIAFQTGNLQLAVDLLKKAIGVNPNHASAYSNIGIALKKLKQYEAAVEYFNKAIAIKPDFAEAHSNRGIVLKELRQYEAALESCNAAIAIKPDLAEAHCNRGNVMKELQQYELAMKSYDRAILIKPDYADAYVNLGAVLKELNQYEAALASFDRALAIKPECVEAYSNRGIVLQELKKPSMAIASYDRALAIKCDYAEAYSNRGNALRELFQYEAALESYNVAIAIKPDFAEAYSNRGIALKELKQYEAALESYSQAIAIKPDYAQAYSNLGVALQEVTQLEAAVASYDLAIALNPDFAEAYINRGDALRELKQLDDAVASYGRAMAIKSDCGYTSGTLLFTKMSLCDWTNNERDIAELVSKIERDEKASPVFALLPVVGSLSLQRKATGEVVRNNYPANISLGSMPKRARSGKIRIGYYSADFHNHATTYLMAELFERHDRNRFELIAFSFGPDSEDHMRKRVSIAFDKFIDVGMKSDKDVAKLSRVLAIDIAIDLKGFTQNQRAGIFSYRAAPIQVSYLGYPGTMAADYIDYLIADKTLIPEGSEEHYSEKIVYLPNSYQVNDSKRKISDKKFTRLELGLPQTGFVFCCFNNNYKITPHIFEAWIRILNKVEGSVLWLYEDNSMAAKNLRKEAEKRGLDPRRLVFAERIDLPEHLARHRVADLFLDTLPCNAHTTASDALWAGLPLLTLTGEAFASRVAASLLSAIDLPEMITNTQEHYESLAIELATHPEKLQAVRMKLSRNRSTTPLFDIGLYTTHLEDAYVQMHERYLSDLPPVHIFVA